MDGTDWTRSRATPTSGTGIEIDRRISATTGCQTKFYCMCRAMVLASAAIYAIGRQTIASDLGAPRPRGTLYKRPSLAGLGAGIAKRAFTAPHVDNRESILVKGDQLRRARTHTIAATGTCIFKLNAFQRAEWANWSQFRELPPEKCASFSALHNASFQLVSGWRCSPLNARHYQVRT